MPPRFAHCTFDPEATYLLRYYPVEEFSASNEWSQQAESVVRTIDGTLRIRLRFPDEQEHVLWVEEQTPQGPRFIGDFRVYSLRPDLYSLCPYKGDFHIHSIRSDGKEAPAYVAAACRQIGLDFLAITDHRRYEPSLEAQRAFQELPIDLRLYPGEEVHPPENPVHIINFGGAASLNALFDSPGYRDEIAARLQTMPSTPVGVDRYQYASCCWCFDKIREFGGLGIFCHPYWFTQHRYAPSGALTSLLFETQPFDAYEVVGGYYRHEVDSNTLQIARYHEEQRRGRRLPIVGVSDAHGCHTGALFGWYYTILFAPELTLPSIIESVQALRSVAVEAVAGESGRVYGPFRLVKYALYLLREIFPQHDALCAEEGALMIDHLAGANDAAMRLAQWQGRTARLWRHYRDVDPI